MIFYFFYFGKRLTFAEIFIMKFISDFWLFLIGCILLAAAISLHISDVVISDKSIVVTFIGVLASIIVIGNVSQVAYIKSHFDKKSNELEKTLKDANEAIDVLKNSYIEVVVELNKLKSDVVKNHIESNKGGNENEYK